MSGLSNDWKIGFCWGVLMGAMLLVLIHGIGNAMWMSGYISANATATWAAEQFHQQLTAIATMVP